MLRGPRTPWTRGPALPVSGERRQAVRPAVGRNGGIDERGARVCVPRLVVRLRDERVVDGESDQASACNGLRIDRGAPIRVEGELLGLDALALQRFCNQTLGQSCALPICDHPADDVPAPDLVRSLRQALGRAVGGVPKLVPALPRLRVVWEDPVHRAHRAQVPALLQERRVDLDRRLVDEALLAEHREHVRLLGGPQRARIGRLVMRAVPGRAPAVEAGPRHAQRGAGRGSAGLTLELRAPNWKHREGQGVNERGEIAGTGDSSVPSGFT